MQSAPLLLLPLLLHEAPARAARAALSPVEEEEEEEEVNLRRRGSP